MYSENLSNIVIDLRRNYEGYCRGSDTVGLSVRPVRGRLGVRIPAVTKKKSLIHVVTAPLPNAWL